MKHNLSLLVPVVLVIAVGCSTQSSNGIPSPTPSMATSTTSQDAVQVSPSETHSTATPTLPPRVTSIPETLPATETSLPVSTATSTPRPPTPPVSAWQISDDFFFDNSRSPGCELPCWQNLVIDVSSKDDIQNMFDTVFGFNGSYVFFPTERMAEVLPGLTYSGNQWILNDEPFREFTIHTWVDTETFSLKGILFTWINPAFDIYLSPQRVIQKLGEPSHMLTSISLTEAVGTSVVKLILLYDEGMGFEYTILAPVTASESEGRRSGILTLCLGGERWSTEEYYAGFHRKAFITEPFLYGPTDLSPLQHRLIGANIEGYNYLPLQEVFDTTLEEVYAIALQSGDGCLYMDIFQTEPE